MIGSCFPELNHIYFLRRAIAKILDNDHHACIQSRGIKIVRLGLVDGIVGNLSH